MTGYILNISVSMSIIQADMIIGRYDNIKEAKYYHIILYYYININLSIWLVYHIGSYY